MTTEEALAIAAQARLHADNLRKELLNATDRAEHIRITRLAIEAESLAEHLNRYAALPEQPRDYEKAADERARAYGQVILDL